MQVPQTRRDFLRADTKGGGGRGGGAPYTRRRTTATRPGFCRAAALR